MPSSKTDGSHTLDHVDPAPPSEQGVGPALVVAFPRSLALPVPPPFAPAGRKWFASHGVLDQEISAPHVSFVRHHGALVVRDAGSRNGTWIDGQRLAAGQDRRLEDGTVVRVGRTVLVYRERFEGPPEPSEPLGPLVGPYGLRDAARELETLRHRPPDNVLIEGETGTGKELMGRQIAAVLGRSEPFAPVNAAGVPAGVFESQLFGHVAGAFSDARQAAKGIVAAHDGGTVFFDEIGELPPELQPKLLRLLENRELLPVGADRPVHVDVLVIAASNQSLERLVEAGTFRRDLLARLSLARIHMPPLRERREDVFALAQHLSAELGHGLQTARCEVEAVERLLLQPWPSNIRGLRAVLRAVANLDSEPRLRLWALERALAVREPEPGELSLTAERVQAALRETGGNETQAARRLGVSRGKLRRFLGKA